MGKFRILRLSKVQLLGCIICFLVGVGMIVGATIRKNNMQEKESAWVKTTATVIRVDRDTKTDSDGDIEYMYREVVEYTVDGKTYVAKNDTWSNTYVRVGDSCTVFYNPFNPSECMFVSTSKDWIFLLYAGGGLFAFAGLVGVIYYFIGNAQYKKRQNET